MEIYTRSVFDLFLGYPDIRVVLKRLVSRDPNSSRVGSGCEAFDFAFDFEAGFNFDVESSPGTAALFGGRPAFLVVFVVTSGAVVVVVFVFVIFRGAMYWIDVCPALAKTSKASMSGSRGDRAGVVAGLTADWRRLRTAYR